MAALIGLNPGESITIAELSLLIESPRAYLIYNIAQWYAQKI